MDLWFSVSKRVFASLVVTLFVIKLLFSKQTLCSHSNARKYHVILPYFHVSPADLESSRCSKLEASSSLFPGFHLIILFSYKLHLTTITQIISKPKCHPQNSPRTGILCKFPLTFQIFSTTSLYLIFRSLTTSSISHPAINMFIKRSLTH
jgi:hypothetical protein